MLTVVSALNTWQIFLPLCILNLGLKKEKKIAFDRKQKRYPAYIYHYKFKASKNIALNKDKEKMENKILRFVMSQTLKRFIFINYCNRLKLYFLLI